MPGIVLKIQDTSVFLLSQRIIFELTVGLIFSACLWLLFIQMFLWGILALAPINNHLPPEIGCVSSVGESVGRLFFSQALISGPVSCAQLFIARDAGVEDNWDLVDTPVNSQCSVPMCSQESRHSPTSSSSSCWCAGNICSSEPTCQQTSLVVSLEGRWISYPGVCGSRVCEVLCGVWQQFQRPGPNPKRWQWRLWH